MTMLASVTAFPKLIYPAPRAASCSCSAFEKWTPGTRMYVCIYIYHYRRECTYISVNRKIFSGQKVDDNHLLIFLTRILNSWCCEICWKIDREIDSRIFLLSFKASEMCIGLRDETLGNAGWYTCIRHPVSRCRCTHLCIQYTHTHTRSTTVARFTITRECVCKRFFLKLGGRVVSSATPAASAMAAIIRTIFASSLPRLWSLAFSHTPSSPDVVWVRGRVVCVRACTWARMRVPATVRVDRRSIDFSDNIKRPGCSLSP